MRPVNRTYSIVPESIFSRDFCSCKILPYTFILLSFLASIPANAQSVQWADRVIAFSSQVEKKANSARQILGEPNKLPASGECGCAWSPARVDTEWGADPNKPEYIKVGFAKPERIKQIVLAENYRPGSVRRVWIYDLENTEELVYERGKQKAPAVAARLFYLPVERSKLKVSAVKVEIDPDAERSPPQLDAIGILDHQKELEWTVQNSSSFPVFGYSADLGPAINSPYAELLPRFSPNGNTLYFDRKDHPDNYGGFINDDIWISEKDAEGNWQQARNIGSPLNNPYHNYVCGVSTDDVLTLYGQYLADGIPKPGLSQSFRFKNQWAFPMNLNVDQLYNGNPYAEYHISDDRHTLVMSIEPLDSEGGKDVYVSFSKDQINWSKPLNLGSVVNTGGDEMSPWLSPDGKTLFFSSDAHRGYGKQDIYISRRLGDSWTEWSKPENLGPRINTAEWESHFVPDPAAEFGYFARVADKLGNTDLLRIALKEELLEELPVLEEEDPEYPFEGRFMLFGYVQDGTTGKYLTATLQFQMAEDSSRQVQTETLNSQYKIRIDDGVEYKVRISSDGYPDLNTTLRIAEVGNTGVRRRDFKLYPPGYDQPGIAKIELEPGSLFSLKTMLFRVNSPVISRESFPELVRLSDALHANPDVRIRIEGHTNGNCDKRYCDRLSETRARRVAEFLIDRGLEKNRVSWKGYGKDRPVADNETEEGRKLNQRVDIRVE